MFRGQIISFVLIQNLACYFGDPKHVYYNENMYYFHNPYWGANKDLECFARTVMKCSILCICVCSQEIQMDWLGRWKLHSKLFLVALIGSNFGPHPFSTGWMNRRFWPTKQQGIFSHFSSTMVVKNERKVNQIVKIKAKTGNYPTFQIHLLK